jgi:hypothetical protein
MKEFDRRQATHVSFHGFDAREEPAAPTAKVRGASKTRCCHNTVRERTLTGISGERASRRIVWGARAQLLLHGGGCFLYHTNAWYLSQKGRFLMFAGDGIFVATAFSIYNSGSAEFLDGTTK